MSAALPDPVATTSVPTRRLLALTASAFVVLAAEPTYLLIDTAVVGHLGPRSLAALGLAVVVVSLLLVAGNFVEYGTTGRVARAYGAGRTDLAYAEGVQASWLGLAVGVGLAGLGEIFAGPLTHALAGSAPQVQHAAVAWLRVGLIGLPGVLLVLAGNGWMRGVQQTRQPVVFVLTANAVSAALCPVLVYPAGLGLRGSAIANVVGQAVGGALFLGALQGPKRLRWPMIRSQLTVGRDLVVRSIGFEASFLVTAAVAARMGTAQLAAHQVGMQLDEFTSLLLDSVAIAAQSVVGAALGSGDPAAARRVTWQIARWGGWAGVAFAAGYAALWWPIPHLFSPSPLVQHQMHVMWPWFCALWLPAGVLFALDGVLIGAGDVRFMALLTLVAGFGAFVPVDLAALHYNWGIGGVWAGLLSFYLVRLAGMVARTRGTRWQVLGVATQEDR
ncbi:MAG: MATE family efflux transporter [Frankiaceae bacterium]|nr:MATE family efflux transporter [Frankiaceae bacterium]MBV9871156.1 MATE family efflux transporter [Frankiaceae bacterium]